jgi:hypothetical protein
MCDTPAKSVLVSHRDEVTELMEAAEHFGAVA